MATTVTLKPNAIDISGSTSGTTTLQATAVAGTTTITLPAATDTLVGKATTDTLTNKTLTGAVMNGTVGATTPSTGAFTTLSATGVTTVQAGTAAAPAITTSGDTNTGIFFPAADTIAFAEGGAEAMRIDSSGNVGIGTSSPTALLQLSSTGNPGLVFDGTNQGTNLKRIRLVTQIAAAGDFAIQSMNDAGTVKSTNLYIDSSGNVGIGTTSPATKLDVEGGTRTFGIANFDGATYAALDFKAAGVHKGYIATANAVISGGSVNDLAVDASTGNLILATGDAERMRIDTSGNVLIGTTTTGGVGCTITADGNGRYFVNNVTYNGFGVQIFQQAGTQVGSIAINSSTTTYGTTSDYRLKENIEPMMGALSIVSKLKPVKYKWKKDGSDGQGFIAHELQEIISDCVTGTKDAVDVDGNPVYQGVDTSFLVATLTAAIQEQQALITSLTARIVALEST